MSTTNTTCESTHPIPNNLYAPQAGVILRGVFRGLDIKQFATNVSQEESELFFEFLARLEQGQTRPAYLRLELPQSLIDILVECGARGI